MQDKIITPAELVDKWNARRHAPHLYLTEVGGEAIRLSVRFPGGSYHMDESDWSAFKNGVYTKSRHAMMVATDICLFWNGAVDIIINPYIHKKDNSNLIISHTISWLMEEVFPEYQKARN